MSSIIYEGNKVNGSIQGLKLLMRRFSVLSTRIQSLTNSMVSCRGFNCLGSGVNTTTFSSEIINCNNELNDLINNVRHAQLIILSYSNEENDNTNRWLSVSTTSRMPRPIDVPGETYNFVTAEEFETNLLQYGTDGKINVIAIDGVKAEKW